jgi:V/A-type H+-transporting ATPase subunit A
VDRYCSPARQSAMLRLVVRLVELSTQAVARGVSPRELGALRVLEHVRRLGEEHGEEDLAGIERLAKQIESDVQALAAGATDGTTAPEADDAR